MSGDVQPRKRKDKKKKKEELSIDEPVHVTPHVKGTSAIFGEGDIFIHSQQDHGTGGHWCAKIIFFSLLAVLVTLIGLIILENRGLSELEAKAVESRYSGVLEGWIEDVSENDHHDIHTLELKHHDDDEDHDHDTNGSQEEDDLSEERQDEDDDDEEHDEENDDDDDENENDNEEHEDDDEEQEDHEEHEDDDEEHEDDDEENIGDLEDLEDETFQTNQESSINNKNDYEEQYDDDDDEEYNDVFKETSNAEDEGDQDDDEDADDDDNQDQDDEENDNNESQEEKYEDDDNDNLINRYDKDDDEYGHENNAIEDSYDHYEYSNIRHPRDLSNEDELYDDTTNDKISNKNQNEDDDDDEDDHEDDDDEETEVEHIEQEVEDEEPIKLDLPALPEDDEDAAEEKPDDDDADTAADDDDDASPDDADDDDDDNQGDGDDDDDFLEYTEPVVELITAPSGQPYKEVDEDDSTEDPPVNTLAEEEEYERRQEELRKEEQQASHLWLKVSVGALFLAATHAVLRRACSRGDDEEHEVSEKVETVPDRRMTLIPEEATPPATPETETPLRKIEQEFLKNIPSVIKTAPTPTQGSLETELEEAEEENDDDTADAKERSETPIEELYSDEEIEELIEEEKEVTQLKSELRKVEASPEPEDNEESEEIDDHDDVEIIDDEQIEAEEVIDEEDEEEISDVDDAELLSRLEAKYGRLPEPERSGNNKAGGNSVEDSWPGEPDDPFWKAELDKAEEELRQGLWSEAAARASSQQLSKSARARYVVAKSYDELAEARRDNAMLSRAITAYIELLKMSENLSDMKLLEITNRTIDRINFRGIYLRAEPVYRLLIRRFPNNPGYWNNLTISFLMASRADLAEKELVDTLKIWPEDKVALAHYGFVLKTEHKRVEESVKYLTRALEGDVGPATEPRFYYHLGDALLLLNRFKEAHEVHKRGAALGHFLSPAQRSLYNVNRLKSRPWWKIEDTPYTRLAASLEKSWRAILREGETAKALYEEEKEGLREKGEWSQLDLFMRGREVPGRCARAPVTCAIVRGEAAAVGCRRGQIKFSAMEPGTHVRPHVGPTNCRLRMHLGLSNTQNTFIRVDQETRQWQEGKVFMFDDSFEHEVWHNGSGSRLVLIVDVWHPDLTPEERRTLPAI